MSPTTISFLDGNCASKQAIFSRSFCCTDAGIGTPCCRNKAVFPKCKSEIMISSLLGHIKALPAESNNNSPPIFNSTNPFSFILCYHFTMSAFIFFILSSMLSLLIAFRLLSTFMGKLSGVNAPLISVITISLSSILCKAAANLGSSSC